MLLLLVLLLLFEMRTAAETAVVGGESKIGRRSGTVSVREVGRGRMGSAIVLVTGEVITTAAPAPDLSGPATTIASTTHLSARKKK